MRWKVLRFLTFCCLVSSAADATVQVNDLETRAFFAPRECKALRAPSALHVLTDGSLLLAGSFCRSCFARIEGSIEVVGRKKITGVGVRLGTETSVALVIERPGGGLVAVTRPVNVPESGNHMRVPVLRSKLLRFDKNGKLDVAFTERVAKVVEGHVVQISGGSDGRLLACVVSEKPASAANTTELVALTSDGDRHEGFKVEIDVQSCTGLQVDAAGRILIAGTLVAPGSSTRVGVIRLKQNGSFDASFRLAAGPGVARFARDPNGNIFTLRAVYDVVPRPARHPRPKEGMPPPPEPRFVIERLLPTGDRDHEFRTSTSLSAVPTVFAVDDRGRLYLTMQPGPKFITHQFGYVSGLQRYTSGGKRDERFERRIASENSWGLRPTRLEWPLGCMDPQQFIFRFVRDTVDCSKYES